jgi:hypothetical protein
MYRFLVHKRIISAVMRVERNVFDKFTNYHRTILLGDFNAKRHFETGNWE